MKATQTSTAAMVTLTIVGFSTLATAQAPQPSPNQEAKALFVEAAAEMDLEMWSSACPKLLKSTQMDATAVGARLKLGACYEGWGKLASAYEAYLSADKVPTTRPEHPALKQLASEKANELRPKLAMITIHMLPEVPETKRFVVFLDDLPMEPARLENPFPVDKGTHWLVISVDGEKGAPIKVEIAADGTSKTVSAPVEASGPAPSPAKTVTLAGTQMVGAPSPAPSAASPGSPRSKVPAFVMGGIGVAGFIAGGVLVGVASGMQSQNRTDAPKDANGNPTCGRTAGAGEDAKCADLRVTASSVNTLGNTGIGVLVGGGVLVAAAAVYLLIPSKKASNIRASQLVPVAGRDGGGLVWTGSF